MVYGTIVTGANLSQRSHHWGASCGRFQDFTPHDISPTNLQRCGQEKRQRTRGIAACEFDTSFFHIYIYTYVSIYIYTGSIYIYIFIYLVDIYVYIYNYIYIYRVIFNIIYYMHEHMYKLHRHSILSFSTEVNVFPNDLMRQMPPNPLGLKIGEAVATCQRMVI